MLVNGSGGTFPRAWNLRVFQSLFSTKLGPLTGAPPVRRVKSYSAQSGYVYRYSYEGQRRFPSHPRPDRNAGVEFVFRVATVGQDWRPVGVLVFDAAVRDWEQAHGRELSSPERYAIAKMALFQAFDERPKPARLKAPIQVRAADVEAILETLGA